MLVIRSCQHDTSCLFPSVRILFIVVGLILGYGGYEGVAERAELRRQIAYVTEHAEELLAGIAETKAGGGKAVAYLEERGVRNTRIRQTLLRVAKERHDTNGGHRRRQNGSHR